MEEQQKLLLECLEEEIDTVTSNESIPSYVWILLESMQYLVENTPEIKEEL